MKTLVVLLALTALALAVQAGGGCSSLHLQPGYIWDNPNQANADYIADYANRGGSTVTGTSVFTLSSGGPVTWNVNTFAGDVGDFSIPTPANTISINLDVTLSAPGKQSKNFKCISNAP